MPTKINDDSMPLEIDGRVIATAEFSGHAAADGRGAWIVSIHPGRLFTATRPSRPLCSRNGSPPATARMTRSCWAGATSWACDGPAHQDHDGARGGHGRDHRCNPHPRGSLAGGYYARLSETGNVIDLDYAPLFIDGVEHAVPAGPQAPQIRRPVWERLRRPRFPGQPADGLPKGGDTGGIVAEEACCQVHSPDLPVDLVAHRGDMPRRRPASSWDM